MSRATIMISLKWLLLAVLVGLALLLFFLQAMAPSPSRFHTFEELAASDTYLKGWIPKVIPSDAFDIIEQHDLDSNEQVIEFSYRTMNRAQINEYGYAPVLGAKRTNYEEHARQARWQLSISPRLEYMQRIDGEMVEVLVTDPENRRALYWKSHSR